MRHLPRELLHAVRVLMTRPVLTGTTILTLALGIGGTSAMFSIASSVLLRPMPVPEPDRLVRVFGTTEARSLRIASFRNLQDVADRARAFSSLAIHQQTFTAYGLGNAEAYLDLRSAALFPARAMTVLSAGFGALALLLLLAGTYGVTAYVVTTRRREFALRVALGADPGALVRRVVRRAIAWGLPGAVVGVALAAALGQLLRSFLFGVTAMDPVSLAAVGTLVVVTAAVAAYLPARRVGRADWAAQLR
jgi:hypothetical protein